MITDEMILAAANELSLVMSTAFPDPAIDVHHFSFRFKRRMNRLINKTNHPTRYLWVQRIASFVLILFMGFMLLFAASPSVRASVIGWIKEQYESYVEYFFSENIQSQPKSNDFQITALPDDYSERQRSQTEGLCTILYGNGVDSNIHFIYSKDQSVINCLVMTDTSEVTSVYVSDYLADLYLPTDTEKSTSIIWYDTKREIVFYISTVADPNTIVKYAESIEDQQIN